jgi:hypothetical protein
MARDDNYTRTGKGFLASVANWASFIPFGLGSGITLVAGAIDTVIESAQWLLRGKVLSAGTALVGGSVSTMVNSAAGSGLFWWLNAGQGMFTGRSIGTHARALTENVIGGVAGALGQQPTVLRSYPAGIGNIGGQGAQQSRPGYWSSRVAQEQGQDPQRRWQQYVDDSRQGAAAAGRA